MRPRLAASSVVLSIIALVAASLVPGVQPAATGQDAGELADRFPDQIAGSTFDVQSGDGQWWLDAVLYDAGSYPEGADLTDFLAARGATLADVAVARAYLVVDGGGGGEVSAFRLPGSPADELAEAVLPVLMVGYDDVQRGQIEIAGRLVDYVSPGPPDPTAGDMLAVYPDDEVLWVMKGYVLPAIVEAIVPAETARVEPSAPGASPGTMPEPTLAPRAARARDRDRPDRSRRPVRRHR
jgi:hypothetical protein